MGRSRARTKVLSEGRSRGARRAENWLQSSRWANGGSMCWDMMMGTHLVRGRARARARGTVRGTVRGRSRGRGRDRGRGTGTGRGRTRDRAPQRDAASIGRTLRRSGRTSPG